MALSNEHIEEMLNHDFLVKKNLEYRRKKFAELREIYEGDLKALQQIDGFDAESPFRTHYGKLLEALRIKDEKTEKEEYSWLEKHYPDVDL